MFLEPFWMNRKEISGMLVPGWHRMGYTYPNENVMSMELEKYVRKLHELVGNANTEGMHIVFGTGTTQLFNAAVHALSSSSSYYNNPGIVVASVPFYLVCIKLVH
ncbi:Tryptophan aminotransferase-related protein 4 [Bienertia sinuspersici]